MRSSRLTYAELDTAANRIAHHLIDAGLTPGEHLGLHLYNGIEYLQTVLACLKARLVPVNVNYRYVEEELIYLYRDADLAALVFDTEFDERVAAAAPKARKLRHLVRVGTPVAGAPVRMPWRSPTPRRPGIPGAASPHARPTTSSSSTPVGPRVCPRA